jgi:hypothetical protein
MRPITSVLIGALNLRPERPWRWLKKAFRGRRLSWAAAPTQSLVSGFKAERITGGATRPENDRRARRQS